jgi:hypothetical protein
MVTTHEMAPPLKEGACRSFRRRRLLLLPPEGAALRQPRLAARGLAEHQRARAAHDDRRGVAEDGRDRHAAGAADVHEEAVGALRSAGPGRARARTEKWIGGQRRTHARRQVDEATAAVPRVRHVRSSGQRQPLHRSEAAARRRRRPRHAPLMPSSGEESAANARDASASRQRRLVMSPAGAAVLLACTSRFFLWSSFSLRASGWRRSATCRGQIGANEERKRAEARVGRSQQPR